MKIIVPAIGSRGDIQPYIALCQGLQQAGHDTILATNPTMVSVVTAYGVKCAPVGPPVDMGLEAAKLWEKSGNNMWLGLIRVMSLASALIEKAYPDIYKLCQGANLVVVSDPTAGAAEAAKLGIPWVSVTLQPGRIPVPNPAASPVQRMISAFMGPVFGKLLVIPINRYRRRVGAPLVPDIGRMMSSQLILVPVSPQVAPPNSNWPSHVHLTGYWSAQPPHGWTPPQDLLDFLQQGPQPIAISLGAMSLAGRQTQEAAQITLAAVAQAGVRAIVQGWDDLLADTPLPDTIYHAGSLPHTWLFGCVSAVIHHGGFGTTGSTIRAGIPGIIVPHIIDQFYWAQQAHALGVSPIPIPRARLTTNRLAQAIHQATTDSHMRDKASTIGQRVRNEPDGVKVAVRLLEQSLGQAVSLPMAHLQREAKLM